MIEPIVGGVSATATYPEAAILDMKTSDGAGYACSATLIAPKVVLTAGHCVDGMASWQVVVGANVRSSTHAETYDWKENGSTSVNPDHHDIGLVYLDQPITLASYPRLAQAKVDAGTEALNVGRILDGSLTNSLYDAPVTLRDGASIGYPYDYSSTAVIEHGDSGGPVFVAGTHDLVAVNSGVGGTTQVLARVDLLASWIQERIAAHATTAPPAPSAPAPTAPAPASSACTKESGQNDSFARADTAADEECGSLDSPTAHDWFTFTVPQGTSTVTLDPTGDAVMQIGFLHRRGCAIVLTDARSVRVTTASAKTEVCLAVVSPKHRTQTYRLTH